MVDKLNDQERQAGLRGLHNWTHDQAADAISRVFKFKSFSEAFGFMTRVALEAEKADHHPDWSNSYDSVTISLSTHDAGGLSEKDISLAQAIDKLLA
ncbi:MAG: 4a-hydroxytetrahydrobiopterin dehydratase [Devosia sp.]|nr:4a-hydroxytetrahydrobiopterin dehydratase [Devosia sp.]